MTLIILLGYLALGAFAGVLAGLFGVGGGLIVVPVLLFSFSLLGIGSDIAAHLAIGTSLATIIFTSFSSAQAHHKKGNIEWRLVLWLGLGIVLGCILGAFTATSLTGKTLKIIIGCFAICIAIQLAFDLRPKRIKEKLPSSPVLFVAGGIIGWASSIFGVGGGSLTVPFLVGNGVVMQRAVAVSAACGFPIAVSGALSYLYFGWGEEGLPAWSLGYIYLPALLGVSMTSMVFSKLGAKLAYCLSATLLRRLFAAFLLLVGCSFFITS